jgi:prepilin-type processing-associated H-X9-DG protein
VWGFDVRGIIHRVAWPDHDNMGGQWCNIMNATPNDQLGTLERYTRHNTGSNIGFMDGHAKWRKGINTIQYGWPGGDIVLDPSIQPL